MPSSRTQWSVGDVVITRVDEIALEGQGRWLLPDATPELVGAQPWLDPSSTDEDGEIRVSVHSFVVDIADTRVIVDTGVGNGKVRENPAWNDLDTEYLQRLAGAGVSPDSVDLVVTTHIHRDHVGWNTTVREGLWEPTFPRARYLTSRKEWDFWASQELSADQERMFADSITPIRQAGQLDVVTAESAVEIADGIELIPTPGHTPGHVSVRISSAGETAFITGDSMHHPVQLAHPSLCCGADVDPLLARRTRELILSSIADTNTLLLGSHFTPPTGGHVKSTTTGFVLIPAPAR